MTVTGDHRHEDQDHRIHQRALDLALGLARVADLLVELDEHLGHLAGDLAGADRLEPLELEDLRERGGGGVERAAGRHLAGDLRQHRLELDALALRGGDLQGLEQRRPRVDQGGELVEERERILELRAPVRLLRDPCMGHDPFVVGQVPPPCRPARGRPFPWTIPVDRPVAIRRLPRAVNVSEDNHMSRFRRGLDVSSDHHSSRPDMANRPLMKII